MHNKTILLLAFFSTIYLVGQDLKTEQFLIVTFERSYNKGSDGTERFLWITPVDSLDNESLLAPFYPLFISKNNYTRCINDKTVSFYAKDFSINDVTERFQEDYFKEQQELEKLIFDNKKKVLTVTKKWDTKLKEKLNVYVTPVKGKICSCPLYATDSKLLNYDGNIYLPVKDVVYDAEFWNNNNLDSFLLGKKAPLNNVSTIVGK